MIESVETEHWFPGDLVEYRVDGTPRYGVIRAVVREGKRVELYMALPREEVTQVWPAPECRLLRRDGWNKKEE